MSNKNRELIEIKLKNCNNIDSGIIFIQRNRLNIKYAINGTGKTTISNAIRYKLKGLSEFEFLCPFKYQNDLHEEEVPDVKFEGIESVCTFNEEYIESFLFTPDELLKNSFKVFVKDDRYEEYQNEINLIVRNVKEVVSGPELDELFTNLGKFISSIDTKKDGTLSKVSKFGKACSKGNKIKNIPKDLIAYGDFINDDDNRLKWLRWQIQGSNDFMNITDKCPFCTDNIEHKKELISGIKENYVPKDIEHLIGIMESFDIIFDILSHESIIKIKAILSSDGAPSVEDMDYILNIREEAEKLFEIKQNLENISYTSLKDLPKVEDFISKQFIVFDELNFFNSEKMKEFASNLNDNLENLKGKANILQGQVNKQNDIVQKIIKSNKEHINNFLKSAGFDYRVNFAERGEEYNLILEHKDREKMLSNVAKHLSYGEKNAFALVLFMYHTFDKNPDLIILDDPISSFDLNKRFAILNMLFFNSDSKFKNKTVLLLTHDFTSVIDIIRTRNIQPKPKFHFLSNTNGVLSEKEIKKEDIFIFDKIYLNNINSSSNIFSKIVYLRRYYEVSENEGGLVWNYLSSVIHKRERPCWDFEGDKPMTDDECTQALKLVREYICDFDYDDTVKKIIDLKCLCEAYESAISNYEKLQIYRLIDDDKSDAVIRNFINSTYHVENSSIYQLNPNEYPTVPEYIIKLCDEELRTILGVDAIKN